MVKLRRMLGSQTLRWLLTAVLSCRALLPSPGVQPALNAPWQQEWLGGTDINSVCSIPNSKSFGQPRSSRRALVTPPWHERDTKVLPCSHTVIFQAFFQCILQCPEQSCNLQLAAAPSKAWLKHTGALQKEQMRRLGAFIPGSHILVYSQTWQDTPVSAWPDKHQWFLSVTIISSI